MIGKVCLSPDFQCLSNNFSLFHSLWILPLHSLITSDEQSKVFQKPPRPEPGRPKYRKVSLAICICVPFVIIFFSKLDFKGY